jgi:hypothetical protein
MIDIPWEIAVSADLAFPGVAGHRSTKVRLVNTYLPGCTPRQLPTTHSPTPSFE